ncbi:MAG: prephenate dehydrogenase, partial [Candidatus Omnitrophica bacterium]|nr:prephenate dehydrogenase [Candidatus Omnitrophota bacterium]
KQEIVAMARRVLPPAVHFVGTHPMAGSEKAGARFADPELFARTLCFIAKTASTDAAALKRVKKLWETFGAKAVVIAPAEHDRIVAEVSHLPHLVSVALMDSVRGDFLRFGASGLRDMTRIAAGEPAMWLDISLSNKAALLKALEGFEKRVSRIKRCLRQDNAVELMRILEKAKQKRDTTRL